MTAVSLFLLAGLIAALPSPGDRSAWQSDVTSLLQHRLENDPVPYYYAPGSDGAEKWGGLLAFFQARSFQPVWITSRGPEPLLSQLVATLERSSEDGLHSGYFHLDWIRAYLNSEWEDPVPGRLPDVRRAVELELMATHALLRLSRHLRTGRIEPRSLGWELEPPAAPTWPELSRFLDEGRIEGWIENLAPSDKVYARLKSGLSGLRQLEKRGSWKPLEGGALLRRGSRGPRVQAVRERLQISGDLRPGSSAAGKHFDTELVQAVRRFQERHGLDVDGIVGPDFRAAANRTVQERIRQVEVNLEWLRWQPKIRAPGRRLEVRVPEATVTAYSGEQEVLRMRAIVGTPQTQTRVFARDVEHLTFSPYWNVPESIALNRILPRVRANPGYLEERNLEVVTRDEEHPRPVDASRLQWHRLSKYHFPYRFRQKPGSDNALGRVMFEFPNRFNIFLHDTPDRHLFEESRRCLSNGCVRVERPAELAVFLLQDDPAWTRQRVEKAMQGDRPLKVPLSDPVPIRLIYRTAWVDEDGTLQFRDDVYGFERRFSEALDRKFSGRLVKP